MSNVLKKNEFLLPFARLFTHNEEDAYSQIPFQSSDSFGDESTPSLASPLTWSAEAVEVMAEASYKTIPRDVVAIEENTVPSWLWQKRTRATKRVATHYESDIRDIFNRAVGSAIAKGWKLNLFTSEKHARTFYDEARFALMQRHIAIAPDVIASWGLSWAYGIEEKNITPSQNKKSNQEIAQLSNAIIDALIGKTKDASTSAHWKKLFTVQKGETSTVTLQLSDIAADWHSSGTTPAQATVDLMALRHNDGAININALKQATRILTILLDLQERSDVTIGFANLSPLLMALGLAYDSDAARALAASIAALITAESTSTSAEMAALRGASEAFTSDRDATMRSLRNHRRAVYGDNNDYEKLSVLPAPLPLKNCPDLALVSEAQRGWDEAVKRAQVFGLRATQSTDLTPSPILSILMTSATQGLEPMRRLTTVQQDDEGIYTAILHPSVAEALLRLNYPRSLANAAIQHVIGTRSLIKAPHINHATLRLHGLGDLELEKIEAYLSSVDSVRLAVTPWIIGINFCRTKLKIPAHKLQTPHFDLLKHLGFTDADVIATNIYCYGHGTARNAKAIQLRHRPLFACGKEISADARIRMAAAVQSFISGNTGIKAHLPVQHSVERGAEVTLSAWRHGLKSLTLIFDPTMVDATSRKAVTTTRRIKAVSQPHAKPFVSLSGRTKDRKNTSTFASKKQASNRRSAHKN